VTYRWLMRLSCEKDPEKGARALVWGMCVALLLKIFADMFMFNTIFPEIKGPALNTSTPVLLGGLVTTFGAQVFGSFLAALLARDLPLRHVLWRVYLSTLAQYLAHSYSGTSYLYGTTPPKDWSRLPERERRVS
jgi:hypothetical protein